MFIEEREQITMPVKSKDIFTKWGDERKGNGEKCANSTNCKEFKREGWSGSGLSEPRILERTVRFFVSGIPGACGRRKKDRKPGEKARSQVV